MTDEQRATSKCDACGQEDDHPRHVMYGVVTFVDPVTNEAITMDRSLSRHLDCCNCEHCTIVVAAAQGKKGDDLTAFITAPTPELNQQLASAGFDVEEAPSG